MFGNVRGNIQDRLQHIDFNWACSQVIFKKKYNEKLKPFKRENIILAKLEKMRKKIAFGFLFFCQNNLLFCQNWTALLKYLIVNVFL